MQLQLCTVGAWIDLVFEYGAISCSNSTVDNTTFDAWADFGEDEFFYFPPQMPWFCLGTLWFVSVFCTFWLGGVFDHLLYKRRRKRRRQLKRLKKKAKANCFASQPAKCHNPSCLCTCRFVQKRRVRPPRLAVRRQVCLRRIRRLNAWVQGKNIRLKSIQRLRAHICRHLQMQKSLRGPNIHVSGHLQCGQYQPTSGASGLGIAHPPLESHHYPNTSGRRPLFRAGAGGSAATKRQRQEKLLLHGLQQLLQTALVEEPSTPDASPRGRSALRECSPGARSESPCEWKVVRRKGKGKGKHGKGKLGPDLAPSPETTHRRVQCADDPVAAVKPQPTSSLLAQLKAIVLAAEAQGGYNLLAELQNLVSRFSGNAQPPNLFKMASASTKKWWIGETSALHRVVAKLEEGEEPDGKLLHLYSP